MTDINVLIASAIPVAPPDDWFENPGLTQPSAIKVLPNGRVFGHVASWDMDHIGMPFATRPPKNKSGYAYFRTGELLTASGGLVPVGQLTLAGGHASLQATAAEAVKHYDDTASAIADVNCGEDAHGIWVAGAVRPGASPEQIRALRASAPSGDWRQINGRLEMVAVCQVNVPGFPVPRALAAGGHRLALVAGGSMPLLAQVMVEGEIEARLMRLEHAQNEVEAQRTALVASAARERVAKARNASLEHEAAMARMRVRDPKKWREAQAITAAARVAAEEKNLTKLAHQLQTGDVLLESYTDVDRAVRAARRMGRDYTRTVRDTIVASAVDLHAFSALPPAWRPSALVAAGVAEGSPVVAAGNFDHLDTDFLSSKAAEQPRDNNGRFVQTGAFLRWQTPGKEGYEFGQVVGRKVNPDGTMDIRLADSNTVIKRKPDSVEVIKAILPADQVDKKDDRGIPYKRKEARPGAAHPMGTPGATPPLNKVDPLTDDVPSTDAAVEPGVTPPSFAVGERVRLLNSPDDLGTVTKSDDPAAIEVTDDAGLATVHDSNELEVVDEMPVSDVTTAPSATAGPAL